MKTYKEWRDGGGEFTRIVIPLVRRIYPQLIADKLINIQPLGKPASIPYYLHSIKYPRRMKTYEQWVKEQDV